MAERRRADVRHQRSDPLALGKDPSVTAARREHRRQEWLETRDIDGGRAFGRLDLQGVSALSGARLRHFRLLSRQQQIAAIRRLAAGGMSAHGISHATGLSVEAIAALPCGVLHVEGGAA